MLQHIFRSMFLSITVFIVTLVVPDYLIPSSTTNLKFSSRESEIVLQTNASMYLRPNSIPCGWGRSSIIKQRNNEGNYNLVTYTGGDKIITAVEAPSDLVYDNSNAIGIVGTAIKNNSNALLFGDRVNSNALLQISDRANSNAIVKLDIDRRTNSNALLFGDRITSRALLYGDRTNSNAIIKLDIDRRTNSNALLFGDRITSRALLYGDRVNSNAIVNLSGAGSGTVREQNVVLHAGQLIHGLERFNNGFTILAGQHAFFDSCLSVSNGFDLRETGSLVLLGNLRLDGNTTLTTGGNIRSYNRSLILDGNLTLTTEKVLHVSGNLIIDGNNHTLILESKSHLIVDPNSTLTLRNLIVKTKPSALSYPPIFLATPTSKLSLDNSILEPTNDFLFPQGQFFVHNDVKFTGSAAFIYRSPSPSFICSQSSLCFEQGTTFSIIPATYTEAPFTLKNTFTSNNFIKMIDATSVLILNGCSLHSTLTGCRFTKGTLYVDNKVSCKSNTAQKLSTIPLTLVGSSATTAVGPTAVSWSPDSRYVSVTSQLGNRFQIFSFNGSSTPTATWVVTGLSEPQAALWSPDGRYIAVINYTGDTLRTYTFNGKTTPTQIGTSQTTGAAPFSAAWAPDGTHITVANSSGTSFQIFTFDGTHSPVLANTTSLGTNTPLSIAWAPDGQFIALVNANGDHLRIYSYSGSGAPVQVGGNASTGTGSYPTSVVWSPDGRFLAVANNGNNTISVFRFTGTNTPQLVGSTSTTTNIPVSVSWSPDGRYIALATSNNIQIYTFNGSSAPALLGSITAGSSPSALAWSPDGNYIALIDWPDNSLRIYRANYGNDTTRQALSKSIVFGDRTNGSTHDLNINIAPGGSLDVRGTMNYDNVN